MAHRGEARERHNGCQGRVLGLSRDSGDRVNCGGIEHSAVCTSNDCLAALISLQLPASVQKYSEIRQVILQATIGCARSGSWNTGACFWCATEARGPTCCAQRACRLAALDTVARTQRASDHWAGHQQAKLWPREMVICTTSQDQHACGGLIRHLASAGTWRPKMV